MKTHQYHVWNEHIDIIVSVPVDSHEYAESFAKSVAVDFYDAKKEETDEVNCEFVCSFRTESAINLNLLSNADKKEGIHGKK